MRKSQFRLLILGLLLTGFAGASPVAAANPKKTSGTFTVHLRNFARVDPKTLAEAEKVTTDVFRQAGVETRWVDQAIGSSPEIKSEGGDGPPLLGLSDLWLTMLSRSMAAALGLPSDVMGVAPGRGPERQIAYVFYDSLEPLAERQVVALRKGDISRPATRAQILGNMMAHEIGHLLLNLPSHSDSGIMRGNWDLKDLQDVAFGSLLFTPAQAAVLREEVVRRGQRREAADATQSLISPDSLNE